MHRLVVVLGLFYSDIRRAYAFVLYGRRGEVWWSSPGEILVEYVQSCDMTKNPLYRTIPFLDFWVLERY